jgi:hypothetical protein
MLRSISVSSRPFDAAFGQASGRQRDAAFAQHRAAILRRPAPRLHTRKLHVRQCKRHFSLAVH